MLVLRRERVPQAGADFFSLSASLSSSLFCIYITYLVLVLNSTMDMFLILFLFASDRDDGIVALLYFALFFFSAGALSACFLAFVNSGLNSGKMSHP